MSVALAVQNFGDVTLSITAEALLFQERALAAAKSITSVTDKAGMEAAVATVASLKGLIKTMETSREDVKAPVLKLGRDIDAKATEYKAPLLAEGSRVHALVQDYYKAEARKAEAAQRFQNAMAEKKRLAEEKRAQEALEEAARLKQEAGTAESVQEALQTQAQAEVFEQVAESAQERAETTVAKVVAAPQKAQGMSVRKVWKHQVLDLDALYRARPELVVLTAKTSLINSTINGGDRNIPGLRIWEDTDVTVRSR